MSNIALSKVLECSTARGIDRLVMVVIADRMNEAGKAWCGSSDIANRANISRQNVTRSVRSLSDSGELETEFRTGPRFTNIYTLSGALNLRTSHPETVSPRVTGALTLRQKCSHPETQTQGTQKNPHIVEISEILKVWNSLKNIPRVQKLNPDRKKHLTARLKDSYFRDNWKEGIERIAKSDFCAGKGNTGWKADFDWFINPNTLPKIIEGKYDNRVVTTKTRSCL